MGVYIVGFICALILAAIVTAWIAYCMFVKERHKSEYYHYNISDIEHRNYVLSMRNDECNEEVTAGVLVLPSKKNNIDYKRPDYPESPVPITNSSEKLIEILDGETECYKDGIYEVDTLPLHSDV